MKKLILILMVFFLVHLVSSQESFNIQMEIPDEYKIISPGEEVLTTIKLINLGSSNRVDVVLDFWIVDSNKKTIFEKKETIAIETQASLVRKFDVPKNAKGKHNVFAKVTYGEGKEAVTQYSFEVKSKIQIIYYAVLLVIALFILILLSFKNKNTFKKILIKAKVRKIVKNRLS